MGFREGFREGTREDWKSGIGATISGRDLSLRLFSPSLFFFCFSVGIFVLGWSCEFRGGSVLGLCGVLVRLGEGEEKRGRERNPMPVCLRSLVADSALPFNYPLLGSDDGCFPPIHHSFTHRMDFIYAHDLNWYLFSMSNGNCYDSITFENFAFVTAYVK